MAISSSSRNRPIIPMTPSTGTSAIRSREQFLISHQVPGLERVHYGNLSVQLRSYDSVSQASCLDDSQVLTCNSLGPMITPGIQVVSMKYGVSLDMVSSLLIGFLAFWIGFTTFFTASGANIWGKRPFFVISALVLLATNVWGFFSSVGLPRQNLPGTLLTLASPSLL